MSVDLRTIAYAPLLAVMAYFASGAELYIFEATSIPPVYGQITGLGLMIAGIGAITILTDGRALALSRSTAAAYVALIVYAVVTASSFVYSVQNEIVLEALIARIKAVLFIVASSLILLDAKTREGFAFTAGAVAVLGSLLSVYDFVVPTFSSVSGRGAGFYLNSNEAAAMLVTFGLIATFRVRVLTTYILWTIISAGVLVTFSRAGWLLLFLALLAITFAGRLGGGRGRFVFLAVVGAMLVGVLAAYLSGDLYLWVSGSSLAEFLDPNTVARLGARGVAFDDYSSIERSDVFWYGVEKFLESPFVGWGVGYGYVWQESVNTHNMPLTLAVELGLIGPIFYFGFFGLLIARNRGLARILSVILFLTGMFTHNQLELLAPAISIGFAVACLNASIQRQSAPGTTSRMALRPSRAT